jgi:hypothetical protein
VESDPSAVLYKEKDRQQNDESSELWGQLHAAWHLGDFEPDGLWRHAACRPSRVGPAARSRCRDRCLASADATALHCTREYTVKQLELDASRYEDLRKFTERVAYDEATSAVLKKK